MKFPPLAKIGCAALTVALSAALLAGCSSSSSSASASASASGPKEITIGTGQTCKTLNPSTNYDGWYSIRYGVCQTLTKMNEDMSISGWLAADYAPSNGNATWTITIKDGVKFSNGKPLTAADVKASLEWTCANSPRTADYFAIASMEADGQKLIINTSKPEPIMPNKLADPLFSIVDTTADMSQIDTKGPIGTGPYVFASFDTTTQETVVTKNENYWGGTVGCDKVTITFTEEQTTLTNGLKNGNFDAVYNVSMNDIGQFENNKDYVISRTASGRTTHMFVKREGLLADSALREAILMSLDKETYVKTLLSGQYVAGKALVTSSADFGFDKITDPFAFNAEAAVKKLDEAGYKDIDNDGFRETPAGDKLELKYTYYTGRPEQQVLVEATCQELGKIGINIIPDLHDSATVQNLLANGQYDLLCMSINVLNCADPENHMRTHFATGGANATTGWSNAEFDQVMKELETESDTAKRKELITKGQQLIANDGVAGFLCYPIMNFTMKANVSGITSTPADYYWLSEATTIK